MLIEKDVSIETSDGNLLRANVYRPASEGSFPVLLAQGVYGKDVHFRDAFKMQWEKLLQLYPGLCSEGSTGRYLRWETVDPERWVPEGYAVVQVDARGSGKSPGFLDPYSPREIADYYDAIEWAGRAPWSNGKVGLIGVSYFAITQWLVAALRPPHLAAIVAWEGASDHYRDWSYHGGICSNSFVTAWWPRQVLANQHGNGASAYRDPETGERTTGPAVSEDMLLGNRADYPGEIARHPFADAWHRERTPDLGRVEVPLLSAGNWGGPGVHLRGNIEGFLRSGSKQKWLSMHTGTHYESFYLPEYVAMQKRFFDHFLNGVDNGWDREPPVRLAIRHLPPPSSVGGSAAGEGGNMPSPKSIRTAHTFPLPETRWTRFHLDASTLSLGAGNPALESSVLYDASSATVSFTTAAFEEDCEFTGFVTLRLWVSSSTTDLDIFATLRAFDRESREVIFTGAHEPVPVARGWLRASHRKLDSQLSLVHRAYHAHDQAQKLTPAEVVPLDVEIWPTSIVFPKGCRMVLTIGGRDLEVEGVPGRILHNHAANTGAAEFGGSTRLYTGGARESYILLPVIPPGT